MKSNSFYFTTKNNRISAKLQKMINYLWMDFNY